MSFLFRTEDPQLTDAIAKAYSQLETETPGDDTYGQTLKHIADLNDLKNEGVDINKLLVLAGNLAIGFAVLKYEDRSVITSKVWTFMQKM